MSLSEKSKSLSLEKRPKVTVVDAGLAGICTAYYLSRAGCDVLVLDKYDDVGQGTSYANAGRFCPSLLYSLPQASPTYINKLFDTTFKAVENALGSAKDSEGEEATVPSSMEPSVDLLHFGWHFLRNCTSERFEKNRATFQLLSNTCINAMNDICSDLNIGPGHSGSNEIDWTNYNLWLYKNAESLEKGVLKAERARKAASLDYTRLDSASCAAKYSFLSNYFSTYPKGGCVLAHGDWTADAHKFVKAVAAACRSNENVEFRFNCTVNELLFEETKDKAKRIVKGVKTSSGSKIFSDAVVLCTGVFSNILLEQSTDISLPIAAMKGCSIDLYNVKNGPTVSIADYGSSTLHYQASIMTNDHLRVTGFADFVADQRDSSAESKIGFRCEKHYESTLLKYTKSLFPDIEWSEQLKPWCGLRPMTPDDLPLLGKAPNMSQLYLNVGHGATGWTFSAGTALLVARSIVKDLMQFDKSYESLSSQWLSSTYDVAPELDDISALSVSRFSFQR